MTTAAKPDALVEPPRPPRPGATKKRLLQWSRRGVVVLLAVGLVAATVWAFVPKPVPVDMASVQRGAMEVTVDEDGVTRVVDRYVVSAPLAGHVPRIELKPGDDVHRGGLIVEMVPMTPPLLDARTRSEAEARLAAAEARRRLAQAHVETAREVAAHAHHNAERARALLKAAAASRQSLDEAVHAERVSAQDLDAAELAVSVASQEAAAARAVVASLHPATSHTTGRFDVLAPTDGRVLRVLHESEGVVQPGAPLVELGDPRALEIVADVLSTDAVKIAPGAPVHIERWGGATPLTGHVRRVEPSAFTRVSALGIEEQRVNVVIDIDDPYARWRHLGDGFRVEVKIRVWHGDDVVSVPAGAVFRHRGHWAVFRVADDVATIQAVTVGQRNDSRAQILAGLQVGARVITHPSDQVQSGVHVVAR